jgi:hypothetical protein
MSRKFAKVYPNTWKSKKMRAVSSNAKLLGMYFLTSPFYCMVGIYEQLREVALKHTGLSDEDFDQALYELKEVDFVRYDEDIEVVWVVDMAMSQVSDGGLSEKQKKGVINELNRLHRECQFPFVDAFMAHYRGRYNFLPETPEDLHWG